MKTKTYLIGIAIIVLFLTSCVSFHQIGQLTMVSNRNINTNAKYVLLTPYVGATDAEVKASRYNTIQEAIDATVQKVSGGEYIMNARLYEVTTGSGKFEETYFAVGGDVWGIAGQKNIVTNNYSGFQEGDKVTTKYKGSWYTGVIIDLKDSKTCLVTWDDNKKTDEVKYSELTKIKK